MTTPLIIRQTLLWVAITALGATAQAAPAPISVGRETICDITLPRSDIEALPVDEYADMVVRITTVGLDGPPYNYRVGCMPMVTGAHNIANYLITPDGLSATNLLADQPFVVATLRADDPAGLLRDFQIERRKPFSSYRLLLAIAAAIWVLGLLLITLAGRRRRTPPPPPPTPPPSLAELLRPLVLSAAEGTLDREGKAQLERLLIRFWRGTLDLSSDAMPAAVATLRAHPEAGKLLQALERWLHDPRPVDASEINQLLAPYAQTDWEPRLP